MKSRCMMIAQEHSKQDQKYKLRRVHRRSRRTLSSPHRYHAMPIHAAAVMAVGSDVISAVGRTACLTAVVVVSFILKSGRC
jgi:hypothetical protein